MQSMFMRAGVTAINRVNLETSSVTWENSTRTEHSSLESENYPHKFGRSRQ